MTDTLRRETGYIFIWVALLSIITQAVFLIFGAWDLRVLSGNILGGSVAVINFFLMGMGIRKAVAYEGKKRERIIFLSLAGRSLMLFVTAFAGAVSGIFNLPSVLIPLFFPRIGIFFREFSGGGEKAEK